MILDNQTPLTVEQKIYTNPLSNYKELVPFDVIEPSHFLPALKILMGNVFSEIEALEAISNPSWESIMLPLEEIEEKIHRTVGPMHHLKMVKDSPELRTVWEEVEPLIDQIELRVKQSRPLYKAFDSLLNSQEWDVEKKRMIERRILAARLKGVHLEGNDLIRFNELVGQLSKLQNTYVSNILDATKNYSLIIKEDKEIEGLPFSIRKLSSDAYNEKNSLSTPEKGPWKLSLTAPIYLAVFKHCKCRNTREILYRELTQKASKDPSDNTQNIQEQLMIRKELSKLLGFENFANLSLATKTAPNVQTVQTFLENLRDMSWEMAGEELLDVQLFAKQSGFEEALMPWDFPYYSERLREKKYTLSEEELKSYFQFPHALQGLFDLSNRLFGITISKAKVQPPVWDKDVTYYLVYDNSGNQIASFYLDPYSRPQTKRGGAWMESSQNRRMVDRALQLPIAHIICNSTPPIDDKPALLTFSELKTLFHEFGHALQHMLTTVNYGSISGTNGIEWDAVEIPSLFMENWLYHKSILKNLSKHVDSGESIPDALIDKIRLAKNFNAGTQILAQLKYGLADLSLHTDYNPEGSLTPFDIWNELSLKTSHLPSLKEDRFLCSFHHIFGGDSYAAGYYSYKWAEVLSADAFEAFIETGEDDWEKLQTIGEKFKGTFLELGGSAHPLEVFETFRGRAPSLNPLLKHSGVTPQS